MDNIKSITAVRVYGNGNNGNWVARKRMQDGTELFAGIGQGNTLAQAQVMCQVAGEHNSELYQPLPAGVTVKAA